VAFKKKGQTLAVEAAAGRLTAGNLTLATSGSPRYLAALTAAPSGEDPTSIAEVAGTNLRPQVTWDATNTAAAPVEVASSGDIFIGPFSASGTITHVALLTTNGSVSGGGTIISVVAITPKAVVSGDRLKFTSGTLKLTAT
jgi:hypothetical protein